MALTRKFLSALGIDAEKIDEIINAHTETVDGLKNELAKVKPDAEKLTEVQAELDALKKAAKDNDGKNPFEVKYNAIKEEFENYKNEQTAKEAKANKQNAYKALLKEAGVNEKRIEAVLKVTDVDGVELDEKGEVKSKEKLLENIKSEWADFIVTESTKGADTAKPPAGSTPDYENMSDADYYKATYDKKG